MNNFTFAEPAVEPVIISKQKILSEFKKRSTAESIEWLESMTNDISLTPDEYSTVYWLLDDCFYEGNCKPALLFHRSFFPDIQDDTDSFILKRFFRTDLFNDERIKSIPLFFKKIGNEEVFHPWVGDIIYEVRLHCDQNEEFAKAYQNKLTEIRNANKSLPERLAFYVNSDKVDMRLIYELEQPVFEMSGYYRFKKRIKGDEWNYQRFISIHDLVFIFLLQTSVGIQIPCWDEKNYQCRLLLDYAINYYTTSIFTHIEETIVDELFRDHTTSDAFHIICNHLKWRKDNMPQYPEDRGYNEIDDAFRQKKNAYCGKYVKFLEAQLPELFTCDIPRKYIDLLYEHFFVRISMGTVIVDAVHSTAPDFLSNYVTGKLTTAIIENNHEQIRDISRLLEEENKDWIEKIQSRISSAMKTMEIGDHTARLQAILKTSKNDASFMEAILLKIKNKEDKNTPPLSLENFVQKYIPLEIINKILFFDLFQKQNEDVYQSLLKKYPGLSRKDALLERLLPCFVTIVMKDTNKILAGLDDYKSPSFVDDGQDYYFIDDDQDYLWEQLLLCILDQLCRRQKTEPESIALIFEIIFKKMYRVSAALDIVKKYPQVQQLILENCYKIIKDLWDTPICTPITSHTIKAHIPACIIGTYKGLWYGLKPMLVALRKSRREWVDYSLSMRSDCLPNGDSNLLWEIEYDFLFTFRESFRTLRQDMADGLSDWLKPLPENKRGDLKKRLADFPAMEKDREGFDITYTEPDPIWRYAYVRAIADLGVDVDGKGHYIHSVMDMVAKEDPSEMVRKTAAKTSEELKKFRNGWDGNDHYEKVKLAFWWIRQASRLGLNLPIYRNGALETRNTRYEPIWERIHNEITIPKKI